MCRVPHGTKIDGVELGQGFQGPLGHHGAVLAVVVTTAGKALEFEAQPRDNLLHCPERFQSLWHHFLADAITRDDGDMIGGHGLSSIRPRNTNTTSTCM